MNNIQVFVTDCYYDDPEFPHDYECLTSDVGEGKVLDKCQDIIN